ncbi:acetyltransferase [Sphingomonas sp. DT-51]|uniref:acetyltransferase n=1 Tax=Sphingomonas sp. DT-51 TaxID=3396165 RepID=UPI003F1D57B2
MTRIRPSRSDFADDVLAIWRAAVDATHNFLAPADRVTIEDLVQGSLPGAPLLFAVDERDLPLAFMLLQDGHLEALFVHPVHHGQGIRSRLLRHGLDLCPSMTADVNEANLQAIGFYQRVCFVPVGRSANSGQGWPNPLLHLARDR